MAEDSARKKEMMVEEIKQEVSREKGSEEGMPLEERLPLLTLAQGILSFLYLLIFLVNFFKKSENLAPFYGASSLYWAAFALRDELYFRLGGEKKQRVYALLLLLVSVSFLFLFFKNL